MDRCECANFKDFAGELSFHRGVGSFGGEEMMGCEEDFAAGEEGGQVGEEVRIEVSLEGSD